MPTRIALGTCGAVRVETDDDELIKGFANGIGVKVRDNGEIITLYPVKKGGSHFHEYPDGKHLVSVNLPEDQKSIVKPFRIYEADEAEIEKHSDGSVDFMLAPAENRKPPKGHRGHTRNDTERRRHPLSLTDVADASSVDMDFKSFDPRAFKRLLELVTEYAEHFDLTLYLDESNQLHARI